MHALQALNPLDGRYRNRTEALQEFFSEYAFIRYRMKTEIEYLILLSRVPDMKGLPPVSDAKALLLRDYYRSFTLEEAIAVKEKERITNHDIKALEYFLKEKIASDARFSSQEQEAWSRYVHFALTSQDINNTAIPMMLRDGIRLHLFPLFREIKLKLEQLAAQGAKVPMTSRTHGQPASPTVLGKEIYVFVERLSRQLDELEQLPYPAKFGGAVGNFNAHIAAYPAVNWEEFADQLTEDILGLERSRTTTQIEHYDGLAAVFDNLRRLNVILSDLCKDLWFYISLNYFGQEVIAGEVGSSAMPHKVNPIDFENAEGNLELANALFDRMSNKLPVSRLQRDLTDSTVLRNIGVPVGYTAVALHSIKTGLSKLKINKQVIADDLNDRWELLAEAVQVILKREGITDAYEQLKDLTRTGSGLNRDSLHQFIRSLPVSESVRSELLSLTPAGYTGNA